MLEGEDEWSWCDSFDEILCKYGQSGNCICPLDMWDLTINTDNCCWFGKDDTTQECNVCPFEQSTDGECCV